MLISMRKAVTIMTTVAKAEDAARIAETLLGSNLAACVQELPIRSRYKWKNETHCDPELLLLIKTAEDRTAAVIDAVRKMHPYDLPEIIALPVADGLPEYLDWVAAQTRDADERFSGDESR